MNRLLRSLGFVFLTLVLTWIIVSILEAAKLPDNTITLIILLFIGGSICSFLFGNVR